MADTFDSRLKLRLQESGGNSGQWGDLLNQTITNVASVFGFGTHQLTADSDATLTLADDGASLDALKSSYLKITSSVSLTATRVLTFSPSTFNQVKYIENATTGGQSITISQGSGATVTVASGKTAVVYFTGSGSSAAVVDALAGVDPGVTDTLTEVLVAGNATGGTDIAVGTGDDITFADNSKAIFGAGSDLQIYHNSSASYIKENGTGDLIIQGSNTMRFQGSSNEELANLTTGGAVTLFNNGSAKLATTLTGIDVTGSVNADGIGIGMNPTELLDIGSASGDARIRLDAPSGSDTEIKFFNDGSAQYTIGHDDATDNFVVGSANVDAPLVSVDKSGNVGIGTSSPVSNSGYGGLTLNGTSGSIFSLMHNGTEKGRIVGGSSSVSIQYPSGGDLTFFEGLSGGTERMRISGGNLLVGTATNAGKLTIEHSSTSTPAGFFNNPNTSTSGVQALGTSMPSTANNTNCFHLKSTTQGIASYFLYGDGSSSFTSDERQKKNIVDTRSGYLDNLKNLRVVDYHWNNQEDTEDKNIGLIAQEVEQVFPNLVIEHELEGAGVRKNLKGSDFTFILIKAIQEQQDLIESLTDRIAALEK